MNEKTENGFKDDNINANKNSGKDESSCVEENEEINQKDDETNEVEEEALEMKPNQEQCAATSTAGADSEKEPFEGIHKDELDDRNTEESESQPENSSKKVNM